MIKTKKIDHDAVPAFGVTSAAEVLADGRRIGIVYRRETVKTGFKHGYCVGQVPCFRWFFQVEGVGREQDGRDSRDYTGRGIVSKDAAIAALCLAAGVGSETTYADVATEEGGE